MEKLPTAVQEFEQEFFSLQEGAGKVSASKIQLLTKLAIRAGKYYKLVVHVVERFMVKSTAECKLPAVYAMDSVCRQCRKSVSDAEMGKYCALLLQRFELKLGLIMDQAVLCSERDQEKMRRMLSVWRKGKIFSAEVLGAVAQAHPDFFTVDSTAADVSDEGPAHGDSTRPPSVTSLVHPHRSDGRLPSKSLSGGIRVKPATVDPEAMSNIMAAFGNGMNPMAPASSTTAPAAAANIHNILSKTHAVGSAVSGLGTVPIGVPDTLDVDDFDYGDELFEGTASNPADSVPMTPAALQVETVLQNPDSSASEPLSPEMQQQRQLMALLLAQAAIPVQPSPVPMVQSPLPVQNALAAFTHFFPQPAVVAQPGPMLPPPTSTRSPSRRVSTEPGANDYLPPRFHFISTTPDHPASPDRNSSIDPALSHDTVKVISRTLYLAKVPASATDEQVRQLFAPVQPQSVVLNGTNGNGFVKFRCRKDAEEARTYWLNGPQKIDHQAIMMSWASGFGPKECADRSLGCSLIPLRKLGEPEFRKIALETGARLLRQNGQRLGLSQGDVDFGGVVCEEPDLVPPSTMARRPDGDAQLLSGRYLGQAHTGQKRGRENSSNGSPSPAPHQRRGAHY